MTTARDVRVRDMFAALFDGCEGCVELRAIPSRERLFVEPSAAVAVAQFCRDRMDSENLFFGVSTRRDATGGDLAHCLHLGALFVDIDKFFDADRILASPVPPSIVVESGTPGSFHLYYLLKEPLVVADEGPKARDLLRRLAAWAGGDLAAGEAARVLRVPHTLNHKHHPPRPVRVVEFHPDRRFNAADFEWLPAVPEATAPDVDLSKPVGFFRNQTIYKLGRALKGKRLPDRMIETTIRTVNGECCEPPLDEEELQQIIHNVLTQPDRLRPAPAAERTIFVKVG